MSLKRRDSQSSPGLRSLLRGAAGIALLAAGTAIAQEIAPFRMTNIEGSLSIGAWRDSQTLGQADPASPGTQESRTAQSDLRVNLLINTRSYIYHPNLITLDVGGGPIFDRASFFANGTATTSRETLYDLSARATFLQDKPYRGAVFYDHLNPTLTVAPGESFVTENEKYGFDFSLLKPVTPVPIQVDGWRSTTKGRGVARIVDDRIDQVTFRANRAIGEGGYSQFAFTHTRQDSASGSPGLPIQASEIEADSATLDTQFRFGSANQWQFRNPVSYYRQNYTLAQGDRLRTDNLAAAADLRGDHLGGTLRSFARYDLNRTKQDASQGTVQSLGTGLTYAPERNVTGAIGLRAERARRTELDSDRYEATGSARYQRAVGIGTVSAGYATLLGTRDQRASSTIAPVQGESLTLAGTTQVALRNPRVVTGSVAISNSSRTQVYLEGIDYVLDTIGLQTRVQRRATGNIANGESVLVDYSYDVGGTFAYRQFDNAADIGWSLDSYVSLRVRYLDSAQTLQSGSPTSPLNSVRDIVATAQVDLPFRFGVEMAAGGVAEWENHRETILPFRRRALQTYWQTLVPGVEWVGIRTGWQRSRVDYDSSTSNDVNLTGWDVSLWANSPWGIEFQLAYNNQRDTGGLIPRREELATARANWQFRQLSLALWGSYNEETQGDFSRIRKRIDFLMKRDF